MGRKIGVKLERGFIRAKRKLGGNKEVVITRSPRGLLSKKEAGEIKAILTVARGKGVLPLMTYQYHPEPFPWAKDLITLKAKRGEPSSLVPKVRAVIQKAFGSKYRVSLA